MNRDDLGFANDPRAAIEKSVPRGAWLMLFATALLLFASVGWAYFAEVEQTTRGVGRVIPSSQVQLVESLESGIVAEILASEGDLVEQGQLLIKVDDTGSTARLGEMQKRRAALLAELARLDAQAVGAQSFDIPGDITPLASPFYANQVAVFDADREARREKRGIRQQQVNLREKSLAEAEANAERKAESLAFAERELELSRVLHQRRAIPEIEFLRIERVVSELRGEVNVWRTTQARIAAEIEEARLQMAADDSAFLADVQERISQASAELAVVEEALREALDKVGRTLLRAPVRGIVNKLNVGTIGEVIAAGASIVEVVPLDDKLLIEARIRPQDIAFIRPGLDATIRLSAYDYTKYGTLSGIVERIGADTITNEQQETFYQIIVSTVSDDTEQAARGIRILPGMVATIDVNTGSRTVLEYLVRPLIRIRDTAFRDPQ
jgi:membrane fusion protein, adhesin transport system